MYNSSSLPPDSASMRIPEVEVVGQTAILSTDPYAPRARRNDVVCGLARTFRANEERASAAVDRAVRGSFVQEDGDDLIIPGGRQFSR